MMHDIFIYLLKVSAGLAIILLPYYFVFRNDPNLVIKRFYLLAGMAAAWIFPFITFRKLPVTLDLTPTVFIDLEAPASQAVLLNNASIETGLTINWLQVIIFIYLAGLSIMFLKNLFILLKWNFAWLRTHDSEGVAYTKNNEVFTLFTRIFIPGSLREEEDLDNVLLHEKAHIQQLHFIDLMLMEFTLLLTWFNPFSWLISRMIKENHEHLADRQVLSAGINPARYKAQLMNHTLGVNVFRLGTQFNHSLTLKRFKMMKKPKKSPLGTIKIAMLIPAILLTLGLTTGMTPQQKTVKGKVILVDTGKPATGSSIVIRNSTVGTVVDIDGTFKLNVDGNPELVVSFVGYKTLVVKASDIGNKPLKLEVEAVELDLESVPTATIEAAGSVSFKLKDGGEAQPVIVLDGKLMDGSIEDIDPNEILSIEVIKDPDDPMVKAYNAKDGLILITSKGAKVSAEKSGTFTIKSMDGSEGEPTYVVDGKVVKEIDNLDSESIESVSVFKDSDNPLVKEYNATNGLVVITTKEGAKLLSPKEGKNMVDESGANDEGEVFYIVEDMPKFPGGLPALKTYIYSNLEYPEEAKKQGIEGEVTIRFLVNEKGEVVNSEILRSTYKGFDAPALKVVNEMPDWTPGKQRGKAVKVWYVMSIKFNDEKK